MGFAITFAGLLVSVIYEVTLILQSEPSEVPGIVSGLLIGLGMLMAGSSVWRIHQWKGWRRYSPLVIGFYPIVLVFTYPLISSVPAAAEMGSQALDQALTAIWFLCWLPLGMALWTETGQEEPVQTNAAG